MGWVWKDDDEETGTISGGAGDHENPKSSDTCSTKKIVRSSCKTQEVEPGKFVRKCEKTEEILKACVGKPVEVVKSSTEYTEDDVTNEMARESFSFRSSASEPFDFPGLRSDVEFIEKHMLGGLSRFFEAAEEMKNGFFQAFPRITFDDGSSPSDRRETPIEVQPEKHAPLKPKNDESSYSDFAGKVADV